LKLLSLALLVAFVLIAAMIVLQKLRSPSGAEAPWPFYAKRPLSQPEQVLYHRLVAALPEHIVLAQGQVSRVLGAKKGFNPCELAVRAHLLHQTNVAPW